MLQFFIALFFFDGTAPVQQPALNPGDYTPPSVVGD